MPILELIERLKSESKKGCKSVQITGTILSPESGNTIIVTTESQY